MKEIKIQADFLKGFAKVVIAFCKENPDMEKEAIYKFFESYIDERTQDV